MAHRPETPAVLRDCRIASILLLFTVAASGCSDPAPPSATTDTPEKPELVVVSGTEQPKHTTSLINAEKVPTEGKVAAAPKSSFNASDQEVMAVVLDSVLARSEGKEILFDLNTPRSAQTVEDVLYRHEKEPWQKLTDGQIKSAAEAAMQLAERSKEHDKFGVFETRNERIRIFENESTDGRTDSPRSPTRPVRAWLPGYSKNGQFAVVRLVIPWSIHHAKGTYLLIKENGSWTIFLRQLVVYP